MRGKIKSWLTEKGFGFIRSDFGEADVFVHFSELRDVTGDNLPVGTEVDFEEVTTSAGRLQAKDVRVIAFPEDLPKEDRQPPPPVAIPDAAGNVYVAEGDRLYQVVEGTPVHIGDRATSPTAWEKVSAPRENAMGFLQSVMQDDSNDVDLRMRAAGMILAHTGGES